MSKFNALHYQLFLRTFDPLGLLSETLKNVIFSHLQLQVVHAQNHLLEPDKTCRDIHFVVEGMLRSYTLNGSKEITTGFYNKQKFMTDVRSMMAPCASRIGLVAHNECIILSMNILKWKEICSNHPSCQEIYNNMMLMELFESRRREYRAHNYTTEENIEHLKVIYPGILCVIAQKHVASYIGVSGQRMSKAIKILNGKAEVNQLNREKEGLLSK